MRWALTALLLLGCGVPGRPKLPKLALMHCDLLTTPTGYEFKARRTTLVHLHEGSLPTQLATGRTLQLPKTLQRFKAAPLQGTRVGPWCQRALQWRAPPPPPQAPVAFLGSGERVQITWLVPKGARFIVLYRDGVRIARQPYSTPLFTDTAPPGPHRYTIAAEGEHHRTAPSKAALVHVP